MLRTEEARFTSLFGGSDERREPPKIGVVDPACEKAIEAFECETVAEPGRDDDARLESRDADMLLDNRRSHD